jgi:ABC-2 type transport system ATP-binding protein
MPAIVVEGLRKSYVSVEALSGISFEVGDGEVVALLGPNGAGKTTTVEILEGYRRADGGRVSVLGHEPSAGGAEYRDRIGIVLQAAGIEEQQSPLELLTHLAGCYRRPRRVADVLELTGLADVAGVRIAALSGGRRRRLDLAAALIGDPALLFLDEPTTGFDPSARRQAWELVDHLTHRGTTVLLTTHYLDEAQRLADRVIVLAAGRIVAEGDPATLGGRDVARAGIAFRLPAGVEPAALPTVAGEVTVGEAGVRVATDHPTADLHTLTGWAVSRGIELEALQVLRPSLEDAYLRLVGENRA